MSTTTLRPQLPITEAFRAEYLGYYRMLPLEIAGDRLRVAVAGAPNPDALQDLRDSYGLELELQPVPEADLKEAIRQLFAASESVLELVRDLDASLGPASESGDDQLADVRDLANQPPVIRFVNLLIREAHETRASDIHLEATREGLRVRLRLDRVLTELPSPPRALQTAVDSRLGTAGRALTASSTSLERPS